MRYATGAKDTQWAECKAYLSLDHELVAGLGPAAELGGLDRHGRTAEVADLDLAVHLRLHKGQDGLVQRLADLNQPFGHHADLCEHKDDGE